MKREKIYEGREGTEKTRKIYDTKGGKGQKKRERYTKGGKGLKKRERYTKGEKRMREDLITIEAWVACLCLPHDQYSQPTNQPTRTQSQ